MKRNLPFLLPIAAALLLAVCSCGSTWYRVGPVSMTMPVYDNAAASCAATPILLGPVPGSSPGTIYREVIQGAWARLDSLSAVPGQLVTFAEVYVPLADACTVRGWAKRGKAGCDTTVICTPTPVLAGPARPGLQVP